MFGAGEVDVEDAGEDMAVCARSSLLDDFHFKLWYLASHPFLLPQSACHLRCRCHESSVKTGVLCLVPRMYWLWQSIPWGWPWAEWLHPFCQLYLQEGGVTAKANSYVLGGSGTPRCHHDIAIALYCIPALLSSAKGRREHWKIKKDHAFLTSTFQ